MGGDACHPVINIPERAQDYLFGLRAGSSFEKDAGEFQQAEIFGGFYLPWLWGSRTRFNLKPRVEGSAGFLDDPGEGGFIGTLDFVLPTVGIFTLSTCPIYNAG